MNLCGSESEGVEVSTICRIISDIFLCVFRSHRSFRFGAWFEGHSRSKVLRENTSPPAGKIFTQTDRPDLDEAKQPESSRQREFHPKPLTEPYVKVSSHTALLIRSNCIVRYFRFRFLSLAVGLTPQAQCANRLGFCKAISPNLCTVAVLRFLKPLNFLRPQRTSLSLTC